MKQLLPLLTFLPLTVAAQKVDKTVSVQYTEFLKTANKPTIAAIGLDPVTQQIRIHGWQPLIGRLKDTSPKGIKSASTTSEPKKKGGGFMGALSKVAEVSNKVSDAVGVSTFDGTDNNYGVPLLTTRTIDLKTGHITNDPSELISQRPLQQDHQYHWESVGISDREVPGKMAVALDLDQMGQKYPALTGFKQGTLPLGAGTYGIQSEGDGLLGYKNSRCYLTMNRPVLMTEANLGYLGVQTQVNPLRQDVARQQLPLTHTTNVPVLRLPNILLGMVNGHDEDDKWGMYKQFKLVQFDTTGKVLKKTDLTFDFIRNVSFADVVRDSNGQPKGALYIFKGLLTMAGKKHRDPISNRCTIVYVGLDGSIRYRYDLEYGDPANDRGLDPVLAIEDDGQIQLLSVNHNSISKPIVEKVTLNEKGKVASTAMTIPYLSDKAYFTSVAPERQLVWLNGAVCLIQQTTTTTETTKGTYGTVQVLLVKPDFTPISAISVPVPASSIAARIEAIPGTGATAPRLLISSDRTNQFVTLSEKAVVTNVAPKDGIIPPTMLQRPNYVVDASGQKYVFVYETAKLGEAKLVEVSL